jgi:hypothetical protein
MDNNMRTQSLTGNELYYSWIIEFFRPTVPLPVYVTDVYDLLPLAFLGLRRRCQVEVSRSSHSHGTPTRREQFTYGTCSAICPTSICSTGITFCAIFLETQLANRYISEIPMRSEKNGAYLSP